MGAVRTPSPFVGRDDDVATLLEVAGRARAGSTQTVLIGGEAGVGKTRLVAEAVHRLPAPVRVMWGCCLDGGQHPTPYVPLVDAVRRLVADLGADRVSQAAGPGARELARLVPELGNAGADSDFGRARLLDAVAGLLESLSSRELVVLVLEDLHWADYATSDLLTFLTASMRSGRVLICATYRTDELTRRHPTRAMLAELQRRPRVTALDVTRLSQSATRLIVSHHAAGIPPREIERLAERSEGVPFLAEELATAAATGTSPAPRGVLPPSLQELLATRLDSLDPQASTVLSAAAIARVAVTEQRLCAVLHRPFTEIEQGLEQAVDSHVLVGRSNVTYEWRHALLREAAEAALLPGQRRRLHLAWAASLVPEVERDESLAIVLAQHYTQAHDDENSFRWSSRAADVARRLYAPGDELDLLERVLELDERVSPGLGRAERLDYLERVVRVAWQNADLERARRWAQTALAETGSDDDLRRSRLLVLRARVAPELAAAECGAYLDESISLARRHESSTELAQALVRAAVWHSMREEGEQACRLADEGIAVGTAVGDRVAVAEARGVLAMRALIDEGVDATRLSAEALAEAIELDDEATAHDALVRHSGLLLVAGRFDAVLDVCRQAREYLSTRGLARLMDGFLTANEAEAYESLGQWDKALRLLRDAVDPTLADSVSVGQATAIARMLIRRGDADAAGHLRVLEAVSPDLLHEPQVSVPLVTCLALGELYDGRPKDCLAVLQHWLPGRFTPRQLGYEAWEPLALAAGAIAVLRDDAVDDQRWYEALVTGCAPFAPPLPMVALTRAVAAAELAPESLAPTAWDAVLAQHARAPAHLLAYARYRRCGCAAHEDGADPDLLRQAAAAAERMGAVPLLGRIRALARRLHISLPASGCTIRHEDGAGYSLTDRETEVLTLVAAGLTNPVIADRLVISPKTVSVHVSHILAKLGVETRTEAAMLAVRTGLVEPIPTSSP